MWNNCNNPFFSATNILPGSLGCQQTAIPRTRKFKISQLNNRHHVKYSLGIINIPGELSQKVASLLVVPRCEGALRIFHSWQVRSSLTEANIEPSGSNAMLFT
jgi:hypothetical protein